MSQKFTNNASTTLGSAVGAGDTTITVATGTGDEFPAISGSDYFVCTLWAAGSTTGVPNEIVKVTARVGDTMTVVRGQEGTTAQAWNVGDTFALYPTAAFYNGIVQEDYVQLQPGNYAVDTGTANAGAISLDPAVTSYASIQGVPIRVAKMGSANTGAYTLNVNGLGPQAVTLGGTPLSASALYAFSVFEVAYSGTRFDLQSPIGLIPNSLLFNMAAMTVKANLTGAPTAPGDFPVSALATALGFGSYSLTTPGYYTLPNGFIIQWGRTTINATTEGPYSCVFPIAFPTQALVCIPIAGLAAAAIDADATIQMIDNTLTRTGFSAYAQHWGGGSTWSTAIATIGFVAFGK